MRAELRFRHVHLDFHTSEHIEGVGSDFDPDDFAATLERARVDSINLFGRCHHGYVYYNTRKFPERKHPQLDSDLLKEQIEACHKRNIRTPIYITVQWDLFTANEHPEWLVVDEKGAPRGTPLYEPGFYRTICLNTPYVAFLKELTAEVLETVPVDGFWFDIVWAHDCSCRWCRADMLARGLNAADSKVRAQYGVEVLRRFKRDMTQFVRRFSRDCHIFYNAGHVGPGHRAMIDAYTHLELESLPSGGWGYLHFPMAMRYARTLGVDCLGMTGRFHTSWGDFHSFKNQRALEQECFMMLALAGKCCVGDQLHPRGKICRHTYALIGSVYSQVEEKEPWCTGAKPVTEIGVLTPEEFLGGNYNALPRASQGATQMLQEGRHQFDIVDSKADFTRYKVLLLPDEIPVSDALATKIGNYLQDGGSLIGSYRSGLSPDTEQFNLDSLGVVCKGQAPYSPDFVVPQGQIGDGLPATEHVMYLRGMEVAPGAGAEVLARVALPYFNRTHEHFCSHRHTPSSGKTGYPAIVRKGRAIYFAHPVFAEYRQNAPRWCKVLFLNALNILLPDPLVKVSGPSTLVATLNAQERENRWVLHLLHYVPIRRAEAFEVIEDAIPLHDLTVSVKTASAVKEIRTAPEGGLLPFQTKNGRVEFILPRLEGHQMVSLAFA